MFLVTLRINFKDICMFKKNLSESASEKYTKTTKKARIDRKLQSENILFGG